MNTIERLWLEEVSLVLEQEGLIKRIAQSHNL